MLGMLWTTESSLESALQMKLHGGFTYGRLWNGWAALWKTEAESLCHEWY